MSELLKVQIQCLKLMEIAGYDVSSMSFRALLFRGVMEHLKGIT